MKVEELKKLARAHGIKVAKMKKADLIRSIQRAEGNNDCYNTGSADTCGQTGCLWRDDCR